MRREKKERPPDGRYILHGGRSDLCLTGMERRLLFNLDE